jgi:hypothetical protein
VRSYGVYRPGFSMQDVRDCGGTVLHTLMTLTTKRDGRKKVRWCVDGSRQPEHTFGNTTSTAATYGTYTTLIAAAASRGHKTVSVDFSTAFLNAPLKPDDNLFIVLPVGLGLDNEGEVVKLEKSWYGLRQSSRNFQLFLEKDLLAEGWTQNSKERGLYRKLVDPSATGADAYAFCCAYVDDLAITAATQDLAWKSIAKTLEKFKHTKDDVCEEYLGIQLEQSEEGNFLHLADKIMKTAEMYNVLNDVAVHTPVFKLDKLGETHCPALDDKETIQLMRSLPYLGILGKLSWMADTIRRDISYQVNHLKKFTANPGPEHWEAAKQLLRYLKTTAYRGLWFPRGASLQVVGFSDSDWGGAAKGKSVSGCIVIVGGATVMAASTRQKCIAQSSFEAELIAAGNLAKMVLCQRDLMTFLCEEQQASLIRIDNQTTIKFCETPQFNGRTRHIAGRYWLIDTEVQADRIKIKWVLGVDNPADLYTKNVTKALAKEHIIKLGFADMQHLARAA